MRRLLEILGLCHPPILGKNEAMRQMLAKGDR